ncbi:hypothetical protein MBLNU459_g0890t2 [Dothideomycetes sp. NU459]
MAPSALRVQPAAQVLRSRPAQQIFNQTRGLRTTAKMMKPIPKEEHSVLRTAHTISQRLRTLKKIPPELIPLAPQHPAHPPTHSVAVGFAGYSLLRKLYTDGTLRLYRSRGHNQASSPEHTKP